MATAQSFHIQFKKCYLSCMMPVSTFQRVVLIITESELQHRLRQSMRM